MTNTRLTLRRSLRKLTKKHADSEVEAKIFDKVIENMTAEIPQVMFDNRVNEMISELEQRLAPQGISLDLYMQYTGQTIDTVKKAYAEQAEKQVKLRLALEKIAKLENIEVTEDELKAEFDKLAEAYKLDVDRSSSLSMMTTLRRILQLARLLTYQGRSSYKVR